MLVSLVNTLVLSYKFLVATTIIKSEEMSIDAYDFIGSAICFLLFRGWHVYGDGSLKAFFSSAAAFSVWFYIFRMTIVQYQEILLCS